MDKLTKVIEDQRFMDAFWTQLYKNLGLSNKYSQHYISLANKESRTAQIGFDVPQIIQEDWIKRRILKVIPDFLKEYKFNVQQKDRIFVLDRLVTDPKDLEQQYIEEYSIDIKMSPDECRIIITDLASKEIIDPPKTDKGYTDNPKNK